MFSFVMLLLLLCIDTVQSSAVSPVYVQSGKEVLLNVSGVPEEFRFFVWRFRTQDSTLIFFSPDQKPKPAETYKGRIQFFDNNNYDVILMNLQQTDSGVYIARVTTDEYDQILIEHNIIVQDPVSPVELQLDSVTNNSHSCNITVTCSTPNSHISSTFTCVNNACDQDGGEQSKVTNSTASLRVYVTNQMVICEHSNQVSRTMNKRDAQEVCKVKNEEGPRSFVQDIVFLRVKIAVFSAGLLSMMSAVISVHLVETCRRQK